MQASEVWRKAILDLALHGAETGCVVSRRFLAVSRYSTRRTGTACETPLISMKKLPSAPRVMRTAGLSSR